MSDTPDRPSDLSRIFDEFLVRRQRGESPVLDEYCQRFPDLADQLRLHVRLYDALGEAGSEMAVHGSRKDLHDPVATVLNAPKSAIDCVPSKEQSERIGRYRIERVLGKGGFSLVYLAHDDQLQRLVAIKVPHRKLVDRPEAAEAYLTEARTVANLDHPNIVPVHDVGSTDDCPCYVVSKYIDGTDLATRLKQSRISIHEAVELVATVAEALHHAHKQGLVHRDIKPGNLLLDRSGKPFVADFGLALREQDVGKGPRYAGTPAYMSPEQARGEGHRVDGRSDIFSLGVVFYELLVGRQPFRGESLAELMEQVTSFEARPPRQYDHGIPKELDRICLKALSKRASERYSTANDMADDLRHFLAQQTVNQQSGPVGTGSGSPAVVPVVQPPAASIASSRSGAASGTPATPVSDHQPVKIVPKGLRSFDAHDADFFLELLPGPRDRDGLPDSLRFWKTRIEETDADNTFTVGLIYGPSGCGKSSLVKAGLLPRLSNAVIAVYVEATAEETEARLLNGLRKRCPELPDNLGLKETLAALRRGQGVPVGKKVVIVLDQFEQWLHAKKQEENTELVQALRQCDGGRVQCVVMVRDDFWLAVSRFVRDLEVDLVPSRNIALVDLFDLDHARKVLAAFGRAFGKLPESSGETTKNQKEFLSQAVSGLAQEGKVISVRLALFAEMMKGKAWTPASLKAVGGTAGVGVTFLEETFSSSTANPRHRYHQKAARADLQALLPETGSDIKGHMRSYAELLEASGYGNRPKDFDDLIRILDSEIRLITPTDPEGEEGADELARRASKGSDNDARYYQLTHDYLVHTLREWLTRKQKETRRGRAELLLADRAAVWNARPESRQLPSVGQWFQIKLHTATKNWTPPQHKMMRQATRYHAVRGLVLTVLILAGSGIGLAYRNHVREQNQADHAAGLVKQVLAAKIDKVPPIIREIEGYRLWADPLLREENDRAGVASPQKLHASLALLPVDLGQITYLFDRLLDAEPHEVPVIVDALAPHKQELLAKLWRAVENPGKGKEQRLRAASALASFDPENDKWVKYSPGIVNDLVLENPFFLGQWRESFRHVKNSFLEPLSALFRNHSRERSNEQMLATNLLIDYAADQPDVLVDLLLDADAKQFVRIYPLVEKNKDRCLAELARTLAKKPDVPREKVVFESKGVIAKNDPKFKPPVDFLSGLRPKERGVMMSAKRFEVPLQSGKNYQLRMDSKEFYSFLTLQDKMGTELAWDYDNDTGAGLVYTPPADDVYVVSAASLNLPGKLERIGSFQLRIVEIIVGESREKLAKRQANAAVAMLRMQHEEKVWPLLARSQEPDDPRARSYLIHRFGALGAEAAAIIKRLEEEKDVTVRRALVLSLGEFGAEQLPPHSRHALLPKLRAIYRTDADAGLHGAVEWLLRQWDDGTWLKEVNAEWAKGKEAQEKRLEDVKRRLKASQAVPDTQAPQWYVNGQGHLMVVIPDPGKPFLMGSPLTKIGRVHDEPQHKRRIQRTFALAAKPVTVEQFRKFDDLYSPDAEYVRMADLPAVQMSWLDAAAYCNWLSQQEGIDPKQWCYETTPAGEALIVNSATWAWSSPHSTVIDTSLALWLAKSPSTTAGEQNMQVVKLRANYLSLEGYRLPTEAEMEYAIRAGAITRRFFGETDDLLPKYGWYVNNAQEKTWPVGSLKPNDFGLFDVQGNVLNWCQERRRSYPQSGTADDEEDVELLISSTKNRALRGGSFVYRASQMRSAARNFFWAGVSLNYVGFRVARTIPSNKEKLVGTWEFVKSTEKNSPPLGSTVEFTKDGKVKMAIKVDTQTITIEGTYSVDGDTLKVVTEGRDGKDATDTMKIIKLTDKELVTEEKTPGKAGTTELKKQ